VEIYRLKGFLAIMREGNLTRAAERLHLSQSALSSQLHQLEDELELPLFRRTPRGMELTEKARELVPLIEAVLEAEDRLGQRARILSRGGGETLTIGLNTDPGFLRVGAINRRLASLHDDLNVVFVTSQTVLAPQLLRQGQVDLAYFYGEVADPAICQSRLAEVRFCVVIPGSLLKRKGALDWMEVAAFPWVWVDQASPPYDAIRQQFASRGLNPCQAVQAVDEYIVKELVAAGQGVAVMREDEARPLLADGRALLWEKGWQTLPLHLGWLERQQENRRVRLARAAIEYLWARDEPRLDDPLARISY
jgi:DNA-binding transcriptional LysR family regulator